MSNLSSTDSIERSIVIKATRERVWRALTDAQQFGAWFGADLSGQVFAPNVRARGPMTLPGCEGIVFDAVIASIDAQESMSFTWHPFAVDPAVDYSAEEPTLVTLTLADAPGEAILLTVRESGFDKVPPARRSRAFEMNSGGWEFQLRNIAAYAER